MAWVEGISIEKPRKAEYIFQNLTPEEIHTQVKKLAATMTDTVIHEIVAASGISNPQHIAQILIKRRKRLLLIITSIQ